MSRPRGTAALTALLGLLALMVLGATPAHAAPSSALACDPAVTSSAPSICLPKGFREDQHAPLAPGDTITFAGLVGNNGPDVADASVVITLPESLTVDAAEGVRRLDLPFDEGSEGTNAGEGDPLACDTATDGRTVTCHTGALARGKQAFVLVDVTAAKDAPPNTSATFGVALRPIAPDTFPVTAVEGTVDIAGPTHLRVSLDPTKAKVVVGKTITVTATVHNDGPNDAPDLLGAGLTFANEQDEGGPTHFAITNSAPLLDPFGGGGIVVAGGSSGASSAPAQPVLAEVNRRMQTPAARAMAKASPPGVDSADNSESFGIWPIGTITAGHAVTVPVRLKALSVGENILIFDALGANDPQCADESDNDNRACEDNASAALIAVAAPGSAAASPTASHAPAGGGRPIAATGPGRTVPELYLGLLAIVAGAGLTLAARTPRPAPRHRGR